MLVITRKAGQSFIIGNSTVKVRIVEVHKGQVKIGIEAPDHIKILRSELNAWDESKRRGS